MKQLEQDTLEIADENISSDTEEVYVGMLDCHCEQIAVEFFDAMNEIAPDLLGKVQGRQNPDTLAEQVLFCYESNYSIDDWHMADPSVSLPMRQNALDPVFELITSERLGIRMMETEDWEQVYGSNYELLEALSNEEVDQLFKCIQYVYELHAEEDNTDAEATPSEESFESAPVTADWLFKNFRETITLLPVTDQRRVNLFQPIMVTLLCDGFKDSFCRNEFINWLTKFISRFE